MAKYDVAAWMVPLESGLTKRTILKILDMLPDDCDLVPFEIHEENSSAYGYATIEAVEEENGLEAIIDLLSPMVADWTEDDSEYTTTLPKGKKVFIGCDYRTVYWYGETDNGDDSPVSS
ncbi:MAG: hypothetical protein GX091_08325 [Peptococcaceae bacterium]|nr:hypothetical protein [Peptococcaceae bacterium]